MDKKWIITQSSFLIVSSLFKDFIKYIYFYKSTTWYLVPLLRLKKERRPLSEFWAMCWKPAMHWLLTTSCVGFSCVSFKTRKTRLFILHPQDKKKIVAARQLVTLIIINWKNVFGEILAMPRLILVVSGCMQAENNCVTPSGQTVFMRIWYLSASERLGAKAMIGFDVRMIS